MGVFNDMWKAVFKKSGKGRAPAQKKMPKPVVAAPVPARKTTLKTGSTVGRTAPIAPPKIKNPPVKDAVIDVRAELTKLAKADPRKLNWDKSIVDLMKLLDMDSSFANRKALAKELGYDGSLNGSARMNTWLHKEVMRRFANNGGRVPANLLD